ncbi:MAG: Hsp20/alpha crystallin family protein [Ignavibacteriales bacterium]
MFLLKINPSVNNNSEPIAYNSFLNSYVQNWDQTKFPSVDIMEDENKIYLKAEVPGMKKDGIKIVLEKNSLILSGNKNLIQASNKIRKNENFYGSFKRSFKLSNEIDNDSIAAEMENGILTITFNKINVPTEKIIDIN